MVSEIFDPSKWTQVPGFDLQDITYHRANEHGTVRVAFNRPEVRNALSRRAYLELESAVLTARADPEVRCLIVTGVDQTFAAATTCAS